MINNRDNRLKLNKLKKIYDMLDSFTKFNKTERLNSASNPPNKIEINTNRRIIIKKLKIVNKEKGKSKEKLNKNIILDIIKRRPYNRRVFLKNDFNTNIINSSAQSLPNNLKNEIIQTDREYKRFAYQNSVLLKENKHNYAGKPLLEYRIKNYHKKQRNINNESKSNSPIFKTSKNINFPNIYSYKEKKNNEYSNISYNKNQNKNINMKKYWSILNNLRIKLHGNIQITRKPKEPEPKKYYNNKMTIQNYKPKLKPIESYDKNYKHKSTNKYEQICNFSNQMIRDSLNENHMQEIYKNLKK